MAPAVVPTFMDQLQKTLRAAGSVADSRSFAAAVIGALRDSGAGGSRHLRALSEGSVARPLQAVADTAHFLVILHGQLPSVLEIARLNADEPAASWLRSAGVAFDQDRRWMAGLAAMTGGALDLHGLSTAEQVVRDQRDAMLTLAKSNRMGCALGAAVTLVLDWQAVRSRLPRAAQHLGYDRHERLSDPWPEDGALDALACHADDVRVRRAIEFAALQLASLHAQLFDLLEARHAQRLG